MAFLEDIGGFASGLAEGGAQGTQLALQQERIDALGRAENIREERFELEKPLIEEDIAGIEDRKKLRIAALDEQQSKAEIASAEAAKVEDFRSIGDFFVETLGEVATPSMVQKFEERFRLTHGSSINKPGMINRKQFEEFFEDFREAPDFKETYTDIFTSGIAESEERKGVLNTELSKLSEKGPPDQKAFEKSKQLQAEIAEHEEAKNIFNRMIGRVSDISEQDVLSTDNLESLAIQDIADKETGGDLIEAIKAFKERVEGQQSGNEFREQIDALNLQQNEQEPVQVSPLSREAILRATGFQAGAFKFLAKAAGSFLPGEQFPKTQDAINDINLFNQQVVAAVALSPRFNEGEINRIKKFLIPGGSFFSDPPFALRQLLGLRDIFETNNTQMLNAINSGTVAPKQAEEFIEKINVNSIVLNLIPSRELLQSPNIFKQQQQGKTVEDINNMNVEQIRNIPFSQAKLFPKEVKAEMLRRIESGSKSGASGSF